MRMLFLFLLILITPAIQAGDMFDKQVTKEIYQLVQYELWGHYDVEKVNILETRDHTAEWGGFKNGYGIKTVTASFATVRNDNWNNNLNKEVLGETCDKSDLWLLCQPQGHRFEGKVEVDVVSTTDGWKILNRNYRNMRRYVLSNYLILDGKHLEGYIIAPIGNDK